VRLPPLLLALLLALAAPPAAAPASPLPDDERAAFAAALEALRGGDWEAAAAGFRAAAREGALLSDYAAFFLAETLARQGALAEARRTAAEVALRHPASRLAPEALLKAAALAGREGDEPGVAALLKTLLARFPGHPAAPAALYVLGLSLEGQGEAGEAARAFRQLWLTAPATAYGEAAEDRLQLLAEAGVRLPPPTLAERLDRAERLLAGGVQAGARQEAEAVLAELPDPFLTLRALRVVGAAWRRGGRYDLAVRAATRALRELPEERRVGLVFELARLQQRAGAREAALATFERLLARHPTAPEAAQAAFERGRLLEDAGREAEAQAAYRRAASEFPDRDVAGAALWRLGWLAYLRGDFRAAAAEFGRLLTLPGGAAYRHPAAYWAARALEAIGEGGPAGQLYALVAAEAPRGYYGLLAARRGAARPAGGPRTTIAPLPEAADAPLAGDAGFARAAALSDLGLGEFAVLELEEVQARVLGDPLRLYAVATAFAREERYHLALRIVRRFFGGLAATGDPALPRAFWELSFPLAWREPLLDVARQAGLDPFLLAAFVREESSFHPAARSPAGARGLMQLMPGTARAVAVRRGVVIGDGDLLDDPVVSLDLGATYLGWLLAEFADARLAAAAYNAGPVRAREWWAARKSDDLELWVEQIPFEETRRFVKRVVVAWEEYRRIYGAPDEAEPDGR
jgi:soluble lytic murein transglycosylase